MQTQEPKVPEKCWESESESEKVKEEEEDEVRKEKDICRRIDERNRPYKEKNVNKSGFSAFSLRPLRRKNHLENTEPIKKKKPKSLNVKRKRKRAI